MRIQNIAIKNFRLITDAQFKVSEDCTLIVGKNNSAKTSVLHFISMVYNKSRLSFNDCPICKRTDLYAMIYKFLSQEVSFDGLNQFIQNSIKPSLTITISYSDVAPEDSLGRLADFIIDLDTNIKEAIIRASYEFIIDEKSFRSLFSGLSSEDQQNSTDYIRGVLYDKYNEMFSLTIEAINPSDEEDKAIVEHDSLKKLFLFDEIRAERSLDEYDASGKNVWNGNNQGGALNKLVGSIFSEDAEWRNDEIEIIRTMRGELQTSSHAIEKSVSDSLSRLICRSETFGYPDRDDLKLQAQVNVGLEDGIKRGVGLVYATSENETLPDSYNGLGLKNLIKMELIINRFVRELASRRDSLPILLIEEPESHMHPQLQQCFVKNLQKYIAVLLAAYNVPDCDVQVIMTTHSPHISSSVPFSKIRYAQRNNYGITYKDLQVFEQENPENASFVRKYMTLMRCDILFADKIILVEGASERILLPDMIAKYSNGASRGSNIPLNSQYLSIIEVGGAHAHKFFGLLEYLEIPTLIITDIDSVKVESSRKKACCVCEGTDTSNATIKEWLKRLGRPNADFSVIKTLDSKDRVQGKLYITYQTEENGLCGRSFEEALRNANREVFGIDQRTTNEADIAFDNSQTSKTDFAIQCLDQDYKIPEYISRGLVWLEEQSRGADNDTSS